MRDRRWDHLYDREKQPVKRYVLERFAAELADELAAWPPPFSEWVSEELRARWRAGAADRPRDDVVRLAFTVARLELARAFEEVERRLASEDGRAWRAAADAAAGHLIARYLTEKCLALKEDAVALRLSRDDLAAALDLAERRLLRPTPG